MGWLTSDADEIERRRLRGASESFQIEAQAGGDEFFGVYRIRRDSGQTYHLEIRSLAEPINSCDCPDHRINGLGTCKHIEATLNRLQYRRKRAYQIAAAKGSPYIEIFLDRRDAQVRIRWSEGGNRRSKTRVLLTPFFSDDNILAGEPLDTLPAMQRTIEAVHPAVRRRIRVSKELNTWLESLDRREQQIRCRQHFETEVAAGKADLDLVELSLYPYQQEGMLHLAFNGIAKAFCGYQSDGCEVALDDGVGCHGGAIDEIGDIRPADGDRFEGRLDALERTRRSTANLGRARLSIRGVHGNDIGERSADVDADYPRRFHN